MKLKTQKTTVSLFTALIFVALLTTVVLYTDKYQNSILPESFAFDVNDSKLQSTLETQIKKIALEAQKTHLHRLELINQIQEELYKYDAIDTYSLRLGLDKTLHLTANIQKPALAIHTKNNDIYIVGSAMKLMAKNPQRSITNSVPNIYMNDTEIKDKHTTKLDFTWLIEQVNLINKNYQWYNSDLNQIVWTNSAGFILKFVPDNSRNVGEQTTSPLTVYLGHTNIDQKVEKFKSIATILKQKNLKVQEIDLDLLDRSFIK